jgi:hypothetical protein
MVEGDEACLTDMFCSGLVCDDRAAAVVADRLAGVVAGFEKYDDISLDAIASLRM